MIELWRSRGLVRTLVERDLRVRYKQTILGFGWAVLGPVALMLVFTIFFQRAAHFATGGIPYALFSYTALVPWNFFSEAVSVGSNSLLVNVSLLNKVYCPREVFPIAATVASGFDTIMSTLVLVVLFGIYSRLPALATLWAPVLIAVEVAFTLGFVFFASSVLVYLRDVRYVMPIIVQVGLFASPVAYGLDVIPKAFRPLYAVLNPLGPVLDSFRRTVLHGLAPDWGLLGLAAAASVAWLIGGYTLFKRLETGFADIA
jgi:ABC-2 type transport system permease protein/lipopolysaccharide transport system permease protein